MDIECTEACLNIIYCICRLLIKKKFFYGVQKKNARLMFKCGQCLSFLYGGQINERLMLQCDQCLNFLSKFNNCQTICRSKIIK